MNDDHDRLVEDLAIPHRSRPALRELMRAGADATPAVRRGLGHESPRVRAGCCMVLDHHLDEDAIPELMANLDHPDAGVRNWAMHALACDRCKEGACRPAEDETVPIALGMLASDPDHVAGWYAPGGPIHRRTRPKRARVR